MYNKKYDERTYQKYGNAINLYAKKIYTEHGNAANVRALETKEHLRTPPAYDSMKPIDIGAKWGEEYGNIWLSFPLEITEEYAGKDIFVIPVCEFGEVMGFVNGCPTGIINQKNDFIGGGHSAYCITRKAKLGDTFDVALECYAGHDCPGCAPMDNYERDDNEHGDYTKTYSGVKVVTLEPEIYALCFDLTTVYQLAHLPENNFASVKARDCLFDALPYFIQDVKNATTEELIESAKKVREKLAPALVKSHSDPSRGYVGMIGHSHMDTAWLWPTTETVRKCARTYAKAVSVMETYPDYTFVQSSALHSAWMKEYYPSVFEGIKKYVALGRYEPNGGVWVECDCNITGGEAMVRQFLYGQRFTEENFGYRSDTFWLPDTFGYSAAIPQIMLGAGVKYFCTTKISWNDCNEFPEQSFVWRGLDGSEVLTHFNTICDIPDPNHLTFEISDMPDKHRSDSRLLTYGFGDGGGGPTFGMMEYMERTKDLPGLPVLEPTTVSKFMTRLNERRDRLPLWDGELYLELHRGTLTAMHMVKMLNRRAEIALHNMELWNVLAGEATADRHEELTKILLKNQFHDILPGTCINEVYKREIPEMEQMIADTDAITAAFASESTTAEDGKLSLFNPLSFDGNTVAVLDGAVGLDGEKTQTYTDVDGKAHTAFAVSLPAMGAKTFTLTGTADEKSAFSFDGETLVTPYYTAKINENGYLTSLVDRSNHREIAEKKGEPLGTLWYGEDFPTQFDNWEVEDDIFLKLFPVKADKKFEVVSDGAVEFRIRTVYPLGKKSSAVVDTVFYAENRRIDYEVKLDWQDRHHLLKAGFHVNVRSATVKNEIQFGHIDRPTTRNNSLEKAQFEVVNHKWSDLSETNYGVALLNDCKYGMSCEGGDMRLTLHKGGTRPDPFTDFGVHSMKYSLLPHIGGFSAETVVKPGYLFNYKPLTVSGTMNAPALFSLDASNIIAEAVKNAEDVENAYVIRLYECERSTTECTLKLNGAKRAYLTNLLEEKQEEIKLTDGAATLSFRPFEIKTVLVER